MALIVPKQMLVDSFKYHEHDEIDRNHAPKYKEPVDVYFVRIDRTRQYHRDSDEAAIRAEATIYCYEQHTDPFLPFKEQSKVEIDGKDYLIKTVREYTEPFNNQRAIYELEVV